MPLGLMMTTTTTKGPFSKIISIDFYWISKQTLNRMKRGRKEEEAIVL